MRRRPVVGVMGAGERAGPDVLLLAEELGAAITQKGWSLLTGGRPVGVMAAASRGAMAQEGHLVIGVLPQAADRAQEGNAEAAGTMQMGTEQLGTAELDVALFTGMGQARNVIYVLSADVVVVCGGGGAGTASEACHALKAGRPLILLAVPEVWASFFLSLSPQVSMVETVEECCLGIAALRDGASN
jgi:predicted Rossmann-fold nucleotide-binding protein